MWVCLCHGVSSTTIRAAIDQGATTVKAVGKACMAGTDCMRCQRHIKVLLQESRGDTGATHTEESR